MDPRHQKREVTIAKVGRAWLTLSDGSRADIETLKIDNRGYGYQDQCWVSRSAYEDHSRRVALLRRLRGEMEAMEPPPMSDILAAAQALGLQLEA